MSDTSGLGEGIIFWEQFQAWNRTHPDFKYGADSMDAPIDEEISQNLLCTHHDAKPRVTFGPRGKLDLGMDRADLLGINEEEGYLDMLQPQVECARFRMMKSRDKYQRRLELLRNRPSASRLKKLKTAGKVASKMTWTYHSMNQEFSTLRWLADVPGSLECRVIVNGAYLSSLQVKSRNHSRSAHHFSRWNGLKQEANKLLKTFKSPDIIPAEWDLEVDIDAILARAKTDCYGDYVRLNRLLPSTVLP